MAKKGYKKNHPGWIPASEIGKKEPRIDTAEKQRGANNPSPVSKEDAANHPGS